MQALRTTPIWTGTPLSKATKLSGRRRFDAIVVGGGITGLTAAWLLKRAGKKVALLERYRLASGDTPHTTAHLTMVTDLRLNALAQNFGKDAARLTWQGGRQAINTIEKIVDQLQIDCEFRRVPCYLHASLTGHRDERAELQAEAALACELGFEAEFVEAVPHLGKPAVRYAEQAKFHPLKYLAALAAEIPGDGSAIFDQSDVTEIAAPEGEPLTVSCGSAKAMADFVFVATHVPLMGATGLLSATLLQTKIYPYSSYVVSGSLPAGLLPDACFWDTSDPYFYLRVDAGAAAKGDRFIFGGLDHKTGQEADPKQILEDLRARLYTLLPEATIDRQWCGQVIATNDGLPYIGETAERQFVATGFNGNGITFGTLAATMACDAALKRHNPWQQLFSVNRKQLRGGTWNYLTENLDYPYYFLLDTLTPSASGKPESLQRGEGQVFSMDGQRVACSRDLDGKLHQVSAVCTHLGCLVRWNGAGQTWDCPCHGSRFFANGEVLAGPAETPLEPVAPKAAAKRKQSDRARQPREAAKPESPKRPSKAATRRTTSGRRRSRTSK